MVDSQELLEEEEKGEELEQSWSWRKLLMSLFGSENAREDRGRRRGKAPDSYNLYDRKPDFRNNYGWSVALHESDYEPLRHSGIGVYLVNLTAVTQVLNSLVILLLIVYPDELNDICLIDLPIS